MNNDINVKADPAIQTQPLGVPNAEPPDADTQAVTDLGELAFYAATYASLLANGASPAKLQAVLNEIEKVYGYFHVNGNTITFDYNEGAQTVTITDPNTLEILQHLPKFSNPPTSTDISNFLNNVWNSTTPIVWSDGTSQTLVQKIMEYFVDAKVSINPSDTITDTSLILFYFSLVNVPGNIVTFLDKFVLGVGYHDGAMIDEGNIWGLTQALCAHLVVDKTLDPAIIAEGLSISTQDPMYQIMGAYFNANYQNLIANPNSNPVYYEKLTWEWEARAFPSSANAGQGPVDALPDSDNTQMENREAEQRLELSRQLSEHLPSQKGAK